MKKIYFAPETHVVKIQTQHIMTASSLEGLTESGGPVSLPEGEAEEGADAMSRSFGGQWDD